MHPYKTLGTGRGYGIISFDGLIVTTPKYLDGLFKLYTNAAKDHYQSCTGIIFKDFHFGRDVFEAIQSAHPESGKDTAIFSSPIFLCARPIRPFETLGIIKGGTGLRSLNARLAHLLQRAKKRYPNCDGIIIDNIDLTFGTYDTIVFRWKSRDGFTSSKR